MKTNLLVIVGLLLLCSPSNAQQTKTVKAKTLIRSYLKKTLNDPSSYAPVSFSKLDSAVTKFDDSEIYISDMKYLKEAEDEVGIGEIKMTADIPLIIKKFKDDPIPNNEEARSKREDVIIALDNYRIRKQMLLNDYKEFKPIFEGWKMHHIFRAKNQYGALSLIECDYYFDSNMTTIINSKQTK
ncbi:hypothetical protein [uncultured Bacteroides sp.]|uniref:hypothetical protein n=1 Tax=uncultured Bacteroides sp. TaxID=162156 RepID=UPI002AAB16AA|nr:hypothetical protein [uncultured Bacteroides sp.]